jgi:hypothetical protein
VLDGEGMSSALDKAMFIAWLSLVACARPGAPSADTPLPTPTHPARPEPAAPAAAAEPAPIAEPAPDLAAPPAHEAKAPAEVKPKATKPKGQCDGEHTELCGWGDEPGRLPDPLE